jgi:hypothetical protein
VKRTLAFPLQILFVLIAGAAVAAIPIAAYGSPEITVAAATGALISAINALLGYIAIVYAMKGSYSTFLRVVLGGMVVRLGFMLGSLALCIGVFHFHAVALLVAVLVFYAAYLILEILYIQRHMIFENRNSRP